VQCLEAESRSSVYERGQGDVGDDFASCRRWMRERMNLSLGSAKRPHPEPLLTPHTVIYTATYDMRKSKKDTGKNVISRASW